MPRNPQAAHWALADQSVVSAGNFVTAFVSARMLDLSSYGIFAIAWAVLLLTTSIQSALVTLPLSLAMPSRTEASQRSLVLAAVRAALYVALPCAAILGVVLGMFRSPSLIVPAAAALVATQVQDTLRRSLLAQLRFRDVIYGDAVSYLLQAAALIGAGWFVRPSLPMVFGIVALTSTLGGAIQALQLGLPRTSGLITSATTIWELGKWNAGRSILEAFAIQAPMLLLAAFGGPAKAAYIQTLVNLLAITHPLMATVCNVVTLFVARRLSDGDFQAYRGVLLGSLLLVGYVGAVATFPKAVLGAFYGASSPYVSLSSPLRGLCGIYLLTYLGHLAGAILNGVGASALFFRNQGIASIVGVALSVPLVSSLGVVGALLGIFTINALRAATNAASLIALRTGRKAVAIPL